jgi:hypothetical protein
MDCVGVLDIPQTFVNINHLSNSFNIMSQEIHYNILKEINWLKLQTRWYVMDEGIVITTNGTYLEDS